MTGGYVVVEYPPEPIPVGGYVQSPTGVLVPRGLCGRDGCVYLAHHRSDHSWMRPFGPVATAPEIEETA